MIFFRLPQLKLTFDIGHGNVKTARRGVTRDYLFALNDRLTDVHLSDNDGTADDHLPFGAPVQGAIHLKHGSRCCATSSMMAVSPSRCLGRIVGLVASAEHVRELWAEIQ